ncbi:MAG: hypothetical protein JNK48_19710 [Bryobacterales bacterium]|nr:hypothetical protein [Bryobacterales bacterium]
MFTVYTYLLYLALSFTVTVWVARTLQRNGRIFLIDAFHGNNPLADSVNHLLVVGFYLINLGWIVATLRTYLEIHTARALLELLSDKMGVVLIVLGIMHFFNLYLFSRIRRRALQRGPDAPFPVAPTGNIEAQD